MYITFIDTEHNECMRSKNITADGEKWKKEKQNAKIEKKMNEKCGECVKLMRCGDADRPENDVCNQGADLNVCFL